MTKNDVKTRLQGILNSLRATNAQLSLNQGVVEREYQVLADYDPTFVELLKRADDEGRRVREEMIRTLERNAFVTGESPN